MLSRRQLGSLIGSGAVLGGAALLSSGAVSVPSVAAPMSKSYALSAEFKRVTWRETGAIRIETEPDAAGRSLALAPGDIDDPIAVDHVGSNIAERGAVVEFELGVVIREREVSDVSIGSYGLTETGSADLLDVITVAVPDEVRQSLGVTAE